MHVNELNNERCEFIWKKVLQRYRTRYYPFLLGRKLPLWYKLPYRGKDWKLDPFIIFHCEVAFKGYVKFIVNNTLCIFIISRIHREIARATDNQRVTS